MVFKRLKGILDLDNVPKCGDDLLDGMILSRILAALVIELIAMKIGAFPWGYGLPASG
jgi:hypothetical protein